MNEENNKEKPITITHSFATPYKGECFKRKLPYSYDSTGIGSNIHNSSLFFCFLKMMLRILLMVVSFFMLSFFQYLVYDDPLYIPIEVNVFVSSFSLFLMVSMMKGINEY